MKMSLYGWSDMPLQRWHDVPGTTFTQIESRNLKLETHSNLGYRDSSASQHSELIPKCCAGVKLNGTFEGK